MVNNCLKTLYLFFVITFLLNTTGVSQQATEIIHLKDIPAEGIILDSGWKFKVGDDPMYAQSGYDDSGWESINPTLDIHDALPQIPEGNVCWLRIHLSIDSTVSQLVMMMQQSVASEIYLNGKLIHRLGVLDVNPNKIKAFNPNEKPLSFPFDKRRSTIIGNTFCQAAWDWLWYALDFK